MESISLDSDDSALGFDCGVSLQSLQSLVSSDETNGSREPSHGISSIRYQNQNQHQYHTPFQSPTIRCHRRASSRRSIGTEMAIIANSSPEIKALVLPITLAYNGDDNDSESKSKSEHGNNSDTGSGEGSSQARDRSSTAPLSDGIQKEGSDMLSPIPSMIYCLDDYEPIDSYSNSNSYSLSAFPVDADASCGKPTIGFRIGSVSPTDVSDIYRVQGDSYDRNRWFAEEHRDQHDCCSTNTYYQGEERDASTQNTDDYTYRGADEIDDLALFMERHSIRSTEARPTKDTQNEGHPVIPTRKKKNRNGSSPLNDCYPVPIKDLRHPKHSGTISSSRHRRVSYDSLPEISEILFPTDPIASTDFNRSTGNTRIGCTSSLSPNATEMESIAISY